MKRQCNLFAQTVLPIYGWSMLRLMSATDSWVYLEEKKRVILVILAYLMHELTCKVNNTE